MTHPQQPQPFALPQPAKRRRWPWILGGLLAVMLVGCVGLFGLVGFGAKQAADGIEKLDDNQKGANAVAAQMNKPATDGDLRFTVTGLKCGVTSVGSDLLARRLRASTASSTSG